VEKERTHLAIEVSKDEWQDFKELCKKNHTTVGTAMLAAYGAVKDYLESRDEGVFKEFKIKD
jgi:hypothetical protein